jgi:putative ABC transport system permease protein
MSSTHDPRFFNLRHSATESTRILRYSLRRLRKRPALTIVAVFTLAVGIGVNTALFSVADAALLRVPYPNTKRLVMVWQTHLPAHNMRNVTSPANFLNWRIENTVFDQMATIFSDTTVVGGDFPEQVVRQTVTPSFFSMLGINAALGRTLQEATDNLEGAGQPAVLSYGFWQRRFGSDPHVLGTTIMIDGLPQTIVGVMPRDFTFLVKERSFTQRQPDLWVPMVFTPESHKLRGPYIQVMAMLRPGVNTDQAQSAMRSLAAVLAQRDPEAQEGWSVTLTPLQYQLTNEVRPALRILALAVGLVMFIACANVATLLIARARERRQEVAIRLAIGARPWEAVRQMLSDSMVLAGVAGLLGLLLAALSTDLLISRAPQSLIPIDKSHIDLRVLLFTAGLTLLTGFLSGLLPALQAFHTPVNDVLKTGARGHSEPHNKLFRGVFVVTVMALAVIVVIGSGLLIRSFAKLTAVDPGFNPQGLLTVRIDLPRKKYATEIQKAQFFAEVMDKARVIPGVRSASADEFLPFTGLIATTSAEVPGRSQNNSDQQFNVAVAPVESQFFETMGIRLLEGRSFNQADETEATHKVVISEDLAKKFFPNENPIGKMLQIHMRNRPPSEVIGIVREVKHAGLDAGEYMTAYWPLPEEAFSYATLVLRTDLDPLSLAPAVRRAVASVDKDQPIGDVRTMEDLLAASVAQNRFNTILLSLFAAIALLLAIIGIYGIISGNVEDRTKEIGIRMAVGANRAKIMSLVLRQAMTLAAVGVFIGIAASLLLTRLMRSLLFSTSPTDPMTFALVAGLLLIVALGACSIPARRATRVHPLTALRYE